MNPAKKANQRTSWYNHTTAANKAIVVKIFKNSPVKKVIGFAPPTLCVPANSLSANNALGNA